MNLRPRNKGNNVAPRAALNNAALPTPTTSKGSEQTRRGKSKRTRNAEDTQEEERESKRVKREAASDGLLPLTPASQSAPLKSQSRSTHEAPEPQPVPILEPVPAAGPSLFPPLSPYRAPSFVQEDIRMANWYDEGLYSATDSDISHASQHDYDTPVSSRAGTPEPSYIHDLERCSGIMQDISRGDVALLDEIAKARADIVAHRRKARDLRLHTIASRGRRERMEAFFRYWQEIDTVWDRQWLYGDKMIADHLIALEPLDEPLGPPTIPVRAAPPPLAPAARPVPAPVRAPVRAAPVPASVPVARVNQVANREAGPSVERRAGMFFDALLARIPMDHTAQGKANAPEREPSVPLEKTGNVAAAMEAAEGFVFDDHLGRLPCDPKDKGKGKAQEASSQPSPAPGAGRSLERREDVEFDELEGWVRRDPKGKGHAKAGPSQISRSSSPVTVKVNAVPSTPAPHDSSSDFDSLSESSIEGIPLPAGSGDELPMLFADGSRSSLY